MTNTLRDKVAEAIEKCGVSENDALDFTDAALQAIAEQNLEKIKGRIDMLEQSARARYVAENGKLR